MDPLRAGLAYMLAVIFFVLFSVAGVGGGNFTDVSQALIYQFVHYYLQRMDIKAASHVKFWRPQLLVVLSGQPELDVPLVEVGDSLRSTGLLVVGRVLRGEPGAESAEPGDAVGAERLELEQQLIEQTLLDANMSQHLRSTCARA